MSRPQGLTSASPAWTTPSPRPGVASSSPGPGVSRAVSLLPPVHVAIVEAGRVLPSLDELFTLRRSDFLNGTMGSYMNIITGPSRSADIEYTIVKGVHGPGEVHLVLLDEGPGT